MAWSTSALLAAGSPSEIYTRHQEVNDMPEDANSDAGAESETPAAFDPTEVAQKLASFESRIQSGEFDHSGFHHAVKEVLFPLLGEGALQPEAFNHLVALWAKRTHPFDWTLKPYGRLN